jgi:hypothetical protein
MLFVVGIPIRYGPSKRQRHLERIEAIGTLETPRRRKQPKTGAMSPMKRDRSALKEGRGPDTSAELQRKQKRTRVIAPNMSESKKQAQDHRKLVSPAKADWPDLLANLIVDIQKMKELPGFRWRRNSCWLDAALEALYCILMYYGHWKDFVTFAAPQGQQSTHPIGHLYKCLRDRRNRVISSFPGSNVPYGDTDSETDLEDNPGKALEAIRETFKQTLVGLHAIRGDKDNFHSCLVSK